MVKSNRNYNRLSHVKDNDFKRDDHDIRLKRSLSSHDIYERDFYFITSNSTDSYSLQLSNEKWKDFSLIDNSLEVMDESNYISQMKVLDLESYINKLVENPSNERYLIIIIFFTIIHNIYYKFSEDFQVRFNEHKIKLINDIHEYQYKKASMSRVSKITTSYQDFIIKSMGYKESEAKHYISKYKKLISKIFN